MAELDDLRSQLDDGELHQDTVHKMLLVANQLAAASERPLWLYIVASVFGDLDSKWSGRPVQARQMDAVTRDLLPLLRQLVFALRREAPEQELVDLANRLVIGLMHLEGGG